MNNLKKLKLSDQELRKLQLEQLNILIEFDRICSKYNIPYFLYGGTLLGAVRHKGFIPWDDDIDVAMYREDYNRIKEIMKKEIDKDKYFFQTQETDKYYNWVFGRLRLNNTVYNRAGQEHLKYHNGIFIDVFPLDNISENKFKQFITLYLCKVCKKALWAPVGIKHGKNIIHKLVFKLLSYIPREKVISIYEYFATKFNRKDTALIVSHNAFSIVLKKEWYKKSVEIEFEGLKFKAPLKYHDFLKARYGNYTELPSEEKRVGHHYVSYVKFSDGKEIK